MTWEGFLFGRIQIGYKRQQKFLEKGDLKKHLKIQ